MMETKSEEKTFKQIPPPAYVQFKNLPLQVQERLLKRQSGEGDGYAIKTGGSFYSYVLSALAIAWFALLYTLTNNFLWSKSKLVFFALISLVASYLLIQNLYKLIRWHTSRSKSFLLITPHYVIDMNFNDVRYWNMEQLSAVNGANRYQNGGYNFTEITLILENGKKTFNIKNIDEAEETVERINYFRKLFIEATVRNDKAYLDSNDDFRELTEINSSPLKTVSGINLQRIAVAAFSVVLTAGLVFGAMRLNNYFDDKKSWDMALKANRASAFRSYQRTHPQGRWLHEAQSRLQSLYDAAEQKYLATLKNGSDPKAVEAVTAVLKYARATQGYRVKVIFKRQNDIPVDFVEDMKQYFNVKKLLSLDDSLSDEKMNRREGHLLAVVTTVFNKAIPDDILEISKECPDKCVEFLVEYKMDLLDSLYYDERQKNLPEDDRTYYPGIYIDWNFGVQIPEQQQSYSFSLSSVPAEHITYNSNSDEETEKNKDFTDVLNADKSNIYDSMVASAFDDFQTNLISRIGMGESKKTDDKSLQTNTPPQK